MKTSIKMILLTLFLMNITIHIHASCTNGSNFNEKVSSLTAADRQACIDNKMIAYLFNTSTQKHGIAKIIDNYNNGTFCVTGTSSSTGLPLPEGYYLNTFTASGTYCDNQAHWMTFSGGSQTNTCLPAYSYLTIPYGYVLQGEVTLSNCNGIKAGKIVPASDNESWCNTNSTVYEHYFKTYRPDGYLFKASAGGYACPYGTPLRLDEIGSGTSFSSICARSYNDIDNRFVMASKVNSTCGAGYEQGSVYKVTNTRDACAINNTYGHPDNYVIQNKRNISGCGTSGGSGPGYTVTQVTGSTITNVCSESRIPTGYYVSGGTGACGLTYSPIPTSGSQISPVCLNASVNSSSYPGWFPYSTTNQQGQCSYGDQEFTLKAASNSNLSASCLVWFGSTIKYWVPPGDPGYVVIPDLGCSAAAGMKGYKVGLASADMQFCYAANAYTLPNGYKQGSAINTSGCPVGLLKYYLSEDLPPPIEAPSLGKSSTTEPAVNSKPANVPALGVTCPGSEC